MNKPGPEFSEMCLLDLSSEAIFIRDSQDRIIYWNGGAQALYGWSHDEAAGRSAFDLLKTGPTASSETHHYIRPSGILARRTGSNVPRRTPSDYF